MKIYNINKTEAHELKYNYYMDRHQRNDLLHMPKRWKKHVRFWIHILPTGILKYIYEWEFL